MVTDANIYTRLLLYSFLSGIFLRAAYDLLKVIGILILNTIAILKHNETNFAIYNPYKDPKQPPQPVLLKNGSTLKTLLPALIPKKKHLIMTAVTDVIFAIISALTVVLLLFGLNFGEFRWFVFPITAGGYALYSVTLSRPITRLILAITIKLLSLLSPLKRIMCLITVSPIRKIATAVKHSIKNRKVSYKKQPLPPTETDKIHRETRVNKKKQKK